MTQRAGLSNHVDEMLDRRLRDLIESHPTPLVLLGDDGRVLTLNNAAKSFNLEWPRVLPLTQAHEGLSAGEAIPGYSTQIGETEAFLEVIIQHTSQRYDTPVRVTLCRLTLGATARQRARSQRMRALGELSAGWAHDANNALTIVESHLNVLRKQCKGESMSAALDAMESALTHGQSVIDRVSQWSERHDALEHVEPAELIKTVTRWVSPMVPEGIRLSVHSSLKPGMRTLCRPHDVLEALLNLIKNAIEALENGGTISLELAQPEAEGPLILDVRDDGPGVGAEMEANLFEPFLSSKGTGGSGLGLASSRNLLLRSGIKLSYHRARPQGSIFRLTFESPSVKTNSVDLSSELHIAVIDNETMIGELLCDYLEQQGYRVKTFSGGDPLLHDDSKFDLYICDLDLTDMSGWDILNQLRAKGKDSPFILMSGWKLGWDESALKSKGVAGFLKKPFQLHDVASALAKIHRHS